MDAIQINLIKENIAAKKVRAERIEESFVIVEKVTKKVADYAKAIKSMEHVATAQKDKESYTALQKPDFEKLASEIDTWSDQNIPYLYIPLIKTNAKELQTQVAKLNKEVSGVKEDLGELIVDNIGIAWKESEVWKKEIQKDFKDKKEQHERLRSPSSGFDEEALQKDKKTKFKFILHQILMWEEAFGEHVKNKKIKTYADELELIFNEITEAFPDVRNEIKDSIDNLKIESASLLEKTKQAWEEYTKDLDFFAENPTEAKDKLEQVQGYIRTWELFALPEFRKGEIKEHSNEITEIKTEVELALKKTRPEALRLWVVNEIEKCAQLLKVQKTAHEKLKKDIPSMSTPEEKLEPAQEIVDAIQVINEELYELEYSHIKAYAESMEEEQKQLNEVRDAAIHERKEATKIIFEYWRSKESSPHVEVGTIPSRLDYHNMKTADLDEDEYGWTHLRVTLKTAVFLRDEYEKIYSLNLDYNLAPADEIEKRRKLLFRLRSMTENWLLKYGKTKENERNERMNSRAEKLKEFLKSVQEKLLMIGLYQIQHDNYLEVKDAYGEFLKLKSDPPEVPKKLKDKEALTTAIELVGTEANKWLAANQKSQGFQIFKHKHEIITILNEVTKYAGAVKIKTPSLTSRALKTYEPKEDSIYKKLEPMVGKMATNNKYTPDKRLRLLGDLEEKISEWKLYLADFEENEDLKARKKKVFGTDKANPSSSDRSDLIKNELEEASVRYRLAEEEKKFQKTFKTIKGISDEHAKTSNKTKEDELEKKFIPLAAQAFEEARVWLVGYETVKSYADQREGGDKELAKTYGKTKADIDSKVRRIKESLKRLTGYEAEHQSVLGQFKTVDDLKEPATAYTFDSTESIGIHLKKLEKITEIENEISKWLSISEGKGTEEEEKVNEFHELLKGEKAKLLKATGREEDRLYEKITSLYSSKLEGKSSVNREILSAKSAIEKLIKLWEKENPKPLPETETRREKIGIIKDAITLFEVSPDYRNVKQLDALDALKADIKKRVTEVKEETSTRKGNYASMPSPMEGLEELYGEQIDLCETILKNLNDQDGPLGELRNTAEEINQLAAGEAKTEKDRELKRDLNSKGIYLREQDTMFGQESYEIQEKLYKKNRAEEAKTFAAIGPEDYDFKNSGSFSPQQLDAMTRALDNAVTRFYDVKKAGGTIDEAMRMIEHIPASMLPDSLIRELHRWKVTQDAFVAEENEKAKEEFSRSDFAEMLKAPSEITEPIEGLYKKMFFKEDPEDKEKYNLFTLEKMTEMEKSIEDALTNVKTLNTVLGIVAEGAEAKTVKAKAMVGAKVGIGALLFILNQTGKIDSSQKTALTNALVDLGTLLGAVSALFGDEKASVQSTQKFIDKNIDKYSKLASALLSSGATISKTVNTFHKVTAITNSVVPAISVATGSITIGINIYSIAKQVILKNKTAAQKGEAEETDLDYVDPLSQELHSLNLRIAKKSVDTVSSGVAVAGGVATLSGVGAPIGAAIAFTAGAISVGNKIVFTGINEVEMRQAEKLRQRAIGGDREAKTEIFAKSPKYAKMFLAIGALKTPPDKIALEFVLNRGITEKDLETPGMSAQVLRKQLLTLSEEADNHDGITGTVKGWFEKMGTTYGNYKKRTAFWDGTRETPRQYANFRSFYKIPELVTFIDETGKIVKKEGIFNKMKLESTWKEAKKQMLEIQKAFTDHEGTLTGAYEASLEEYHKAEMAFIANPESTTDEKGMLVYEKVLADNKAEQKEVAQVIEAFADVDLS